MFVVLKAYWPSVTKYRFFLGLVIAFLFLGVLGNSLKPFLIREMVILFTADRFDASAAYWCFTKMALLLGFAWLAWRAFDFSVVPFESFVMKDLDRRSFAVMQTQSMRFFEESFSGTLVKQATRFRDCFEAIADALVFQIGRDFMLLVIAITFFALEQPWFAALFALWAVLFIGMNILFAWIQFPLNKATAEAASAVSGTLADSLGNHATVKAFAREEAEQQRLDEQAEKSYRMRITSWNTSITCLALQGVLIVVFELLFIRYLIEERAAGRITGGDFVFFQSFVAYVFYFLWMFGHALRHACQHVADAREMAVLFLKTPEVQDAPDAKQLTITDGAVQLNNVQFSYTNNCRKEVKDLTLRVQPGMRVAIVGPTGAGKTTIVKLLQHYFDLQSGEILIDGQNIAHVTQESLRSQIAIVPQQAELFHTTLRANIAFADPDATEAEIIEAAKQARIWDRICELPEGLQTVVGERGMKLSGGERQRIALARAFLARKKRKILILDEATSALDSKTEGQIQAAIEELLQGCTSIVIAHRLSTIMHADLIVVMEEGRIVQQGTHAALLAQEGLYRTLWGHQSGGYLAD